MSNEPPTTECIHIIPVGKLLDKLMWIVIGIGVIAVAINEYIDEHQIPLAGQTWVECPKNPYMSDQCKYYKVLSTQDRYVQFEVFMPDGRVIIASKDIHTFKNQARLQDEQ